MAGFAQLVERVEAVTGLDDALTVEIHCAVTGGDWTEFVHRDGSLTPFVPRYLGSLDAALTLVPAGWHLGTLTDCNEDNRPHCCLTENAEPCRDAVGNGADLPLSVVAAALRARQTTDREDGK